MKTKVLLITLCLGTSATSAFSDPLYSQDFESLYPSYGWAKSGTMGSTNDLAFYNGLTAAASIQSAAGNHYAAATLTVPSLPSDPLTRWYGGLCLPLIPSASVPLDWSLSFDVRESSADPLQIRLYLDNGLGTAPEYVGWVTPLSGDWNRVTIDSDQTSLILGTDFKNVTTAQLYIFMASHDAAGNPLAASNLGTYELDIDNVVFTSVPEPAAIPLFGLGTFVVLTVRSVRNRFDPSRQPV